MISAPTLQAGSNNIDLVNILPMVSLICKQCGRAEFYSAIATGLVGKTPA